MLYAVFRHFYMIARHTPPIGQSNYLIAKLLQQVPDLTDITGCVPAFADMPRQTGRVIFPYSCTFVQIAHSVPLNYNTIEPDGCQSEIKLWNNVDRAASFAKVISSLK